MRAVSLLGVVLSLSIASAQVRGMSNQHQEQRIPSTLSEAHAELERILSPKELAEIDAIPSEGGMAKYHSGLGAGIRNDWGLWRDSPLAKKMQELGFTHPDAMSGVILGTFWCKRHGQDFRLEERAAAYRKSADALQRAEEEEENRAQKAKEAMRNMMMGLVFEKRDVPVVRMPDRRRVHFESARFLSPFRGGVFISVYGRSVTQNNAFVTPGRYFDPRDGKIRKIQVAEVNEVRSAVVTADTAWFAGTTNGQTLLVGVNDQSHIPVPLPEGGAPPQLGLDGQSLLAVYPNRVFRLADRTWTPVYSGNIFLPRSGPPPQRHGNMILFRDEGMEENCKRLWWLMLGDKPYLTSLDCDTRLVGPRGPRWENSFSSCVTGNGDLWACVGESSDRKSLLRRSKDGSYSIAILRNSVQFTENVFGPLDTDQGLSVSAVTVLPDDTLLLAGNAGLYRLGGKELVQDLAFTNSRQDITDSSGSVVLRWSWNPSNILVLDDQSYFISGSSGGIYLLSKGNDGQWSFLSLDEKLGDPVVW
jgi:hypothetical protein